MSLLNVFLIILSIAGLLLFILGFRGKSQLAILFGVIALFAPIFYFVGWTVFLPFVPVIALVILFLGKKKLRTN